MCRRLTQRDQDGFIPSPLLSSPCTPIQPLQHTHTHIHSSIHMSALFIPPFTPLTPFLLLFPCPFFKFSFYLQDLSSLCLLLLLSLPPQMILFLSCVASVVEFYSKYSAIISNHAIDVAGEESEENKMVNFDKTQQNSI